MIGKIRDCHLEGFSMVLRIRWEWVGNTSSLTLAEQNIEKFEILYPEYLYKTGRPGGKDRRDREWMVGIYRRPKGDT